MTKMTRSEYYQNCVHKAGQSSLNVKLTSVASVRFEVVISKMSYNDEAANLHHGNTHTGSLSVTLLCVPSTVIWHYGGKKPVTLT
jgi:5-methylthioribose kinase